MRKLCYTPSPKTKMVYFSGPRQSKRELVARRAARGGARVGRQRGDHE